MAPIVICNTGRDPPLQNVQELKEYLKEDLIWNKSKTEIAMIGRGRFKKNRMYVMASLDKHHHCAPASGLVA